jgi:hypothetical protein
VSVADGPATNRPYFDTGRRVPSAWTFRTTLSPVEAVTRAMAHAESAGFAPYPFELPSLESSEWTYSARFIGNARESWRRDVINDLIEDLGAFIRRGISPMAFIGLARSEAPGHTELVIWPHFAGSGAPDDVFGAANAFSAALGGLNDDLAATGHLVSVTKGAPSHKQPAFPDVKQLGRQLHPPKRWRLLGR